MDLWTQLTGNRVLMCAALSWIVAQALKVLITLAVDKKLDLHRCFGMGGMPSSHTAFVFSLCLMVGIQEGFGTTQFAIAFALMAVVIYDAMGVRAETGKQGAVLNRILHELVIEGKPFNEDRLKELVGHSPLEVVGGIIVAIIMVIVMT